MRKLCVFLCTASLALADFSYEQRSQVTGGAMAGMMKLAGAFSKKLREPMSTWTYVKGNKIAHVTGANTQLYDIDAETITSIDHEKKTYSVITFAQMQEAFAKLRGDMKKEAPEVDTQLKVDVQETGRKKQLAGTTASEMLISFIYEMKDKKGKESAEMETQSSSWLATNVAGWKEYADAQQRLGQKMARGMGGAMAPFGGGPGVQPGMGESWAVLAEKMSKMNGVPLLQIVRMGPKGQLPPASTMGDPKPVEKEEAAADKPKASDIIGGALGGRLGGFGRKRKEENREEMPKRSESSRPSEGGMLMEMTIETLQMSSAPIDAAKLSVPAGFQQVENEMLKRRR